MNRNMSDRVVTLNQDEIHILLGFILFQIVVGSLANITVICMFWVRHELRRNPGNLLILSLASADLLSCVTILPWILHVLLQRNMGGASFFYFASLNIAEIICCANAVTAVTVDRFIAVVYNLRYRAVMTRIKTFSFIAYSWSSAFLAGIGGFISYELGYFMYYEKFLWSVHISELVLVFVIYVVIFRVAWTKTQNISQQRKSVLGPFERARVGVMVKTIWNSFAIVCLFYASFIPFLIYDIFSTLNAENLPPSQSRSMLLKIFSFTYISSCINPFIYVFRRKGIFAQRRAYWPGSH